MNELRTNRKQIQIFSFIEIALIVVLAAVPLFLTFPYRVNIFLSWEGAYRLSQGQVPYRDFGMPLGFMYWVVPALFFKLLGAQLITLVKAQVFINIVSGLAFRSILGSLGVQPGIRLLAVLVYCLSFSFFNFWPWYNHTVIVYEFVALAFLMKFFFSESGKGRWLLLVLAAAFTFFSFFTKQDGGALAFLLCGALLAYHCLYTRRWLPMLVFAGAFAAVALLLILPFTQYSFGYWFNHGQPPHTARFSFFEVLDDFLIGSQWIKFYLLVVILLAVAYYQNLRQIRTDHRATLFLLLTLGILAQAAVLQVTSYTPPDNNIFFHSYAFAFILSFLSVFLKLDFFRPKTLALGSVLVLLWWSGVLWRYVQRITDRIWPAATATAAASTENVVNRRTYMINTDTTEIPMSEWTFTGLKSFDRIYMPRPTVEGIHRLLQLELVKTNRNLKVLNMTELTPLAVEMPYASEKGSGTPLWHHLGVAMFNREAALYEQRIAAGGYDLVLFEYIPTLNNFYPFRVRAALGAHYRKIDAFPAPRRGDTKGTIEVYVRP